ncbi:MAG: type II toxin-antitoxin system PemK/MazF family toxin [Desulfobacterales bacterium]|nr:type II toxin-antitoxin system PemK/MazF family toxin [Desulfobacterales bacterium]
MKQGEIWEINLSPTIGAEITKRRPAAIVSDDAIGVLPLRVIVPITGWKQRYNHAIWMVKIDPDNENNLTKISAIDTFQIRSISTERFIGRIGFVSSDILDEIKSAIKAVIDAD